MSNDDYPCFCFTYFIFNLVGYGFFVYWHIKHCWLFNAKTLLQEEH